MKTLMQSFGAYVMVTPQPIDRWTIMKACVKEKGWYPLSGYMSPPIGSNCFGIDGYKTIAFELYEQLGDLPEFIAVPSRLFRTAFTASGKGLRTYRPSVFLRKRQR